MPAPGPSRVETRSPMPAASPHPRGIDALASAASRSWRPLAVVSGTLILSDWILSEFLPSSGTGFAIVVAAGGLWLWRRPKPSPQLRPAAAEQPLTVLAGHCQQALRSLEALQQAEPPQASPVLSERRDERENTLRGLVRRHQRRCLEVALVGTLPCPDDWFNQVQAQLKSPVPLLLHRTHPLTCRDPHHRWPAELTRCDGLLYGVGLPLRAADHCWLQSLPPDLPVWILTRADDTGTRERLASRTGRQELLAQLPPGRQWTVMEPEAAGSCAESGLRFDFRPVREALSSRPHDRIRRTESRLLLALNHQLQRDLESLRQRRCRDLMQTTQWAVAAAVLASPLLAVDLVVTTVANGLMLKEMAALWECSWSLEQLRAAATELAKASLALGVVEWSSQSLLSLAKLDGATWIVAGAIQSLSAAYLTRVVCRSMADLLAQSQGLLPSDLEQIRQQAPLLVARAAEQERLDWSAFLDQARRWSLAQIRGRALQA